MFADGELGQLDDVILEPIRQHVAIAIAHLEVAVQVRIVEALGGGRTFMVGDEWQSIYRFRRADVAVFRAMAERLGDQVIRMGENFRSSQ